MPDNSAAVQPRGVILIFVVPALLPGPTREFDGQKVLGPPAIQNTEPQRASPVVTKVVMSAFPHVSP